MASYTPGTEALRWIAEEWAPEIDRAAYKKAMIYPNFMEGNKPGQRLHVPLHANLSVQKPADTSDLSSLTFNINTETEVALAPGTATVPIQVNLNTLARMANDPDSMLRESIELALAQQADQDSGGLVTSVVSNKSGDGTNDIDISMFLEAYALGAAGAGEYWVPGQKPNVVACIANHQIDNLLQIQNITNAQFRGDSEKPAVTGWVAQAFGVSCYPTGNLGGSNQYSLMFIPKAFRIAWNQRFTVISQPFNLVQKLIGWGDYAYGIIRESYAAVMFHKAS